MGADETERPASRTVAVDVARLVLAVIGAGFVGAGGFLHYPPLGLAAAGGMLYAIALIGALRDR